MAEQKYGADLASVINRLYNKGINRLSVIMRHSERHYDTDFQKEPFMSLTDEGRDMAHRFGSLLPVNISVRFFSSFIGRCIETSYLIDKGFSRKSDIETVHNSVSELIAPFYINDLNALGKIIQGTETPAFIRKWIDGDYPESAIKHAKDSANAMFSFIHEKFNEISENCIDIFISHDWNMFLLKEFGANLRHEEFGKIEYLEGLVLFDMNGEMYITNHQTDPVRLKNII